MITIFEGEVDTGKTLACTAYAYKAHKAGKKIFANYRLNFLNTHFDKEDLERYQLDNESLLALDDAYVLLDSRRYMVNTRIVNFILQAEQNGADILMVAIELADIDKRIRERVNARCKCQYDKKTQYVTLYVSQRGQRNIERLYGPEYFSLYNRWEIKPIT